MELSVCQSALRAFSGPDLLTCKLHPHPCPWAQEPCFSLAFLPCLSDTTGEPVSSWVTAVLVQDHWPSWPGSKLVSWLPSLTLALPCHHGLAWQSLSWVWHCWSPPDLIMFCGLTPWLALRSVSATKWQDDLESWLNLGTTVSLPCRDTVGLGSGWQGPGPPGHDIGLHYCPQDSPCCSWHRISTGSLHHVPLAKNFVF